MPGSTYRATACRETWLARDRRNPGDALHLDSVPCFRCDRTDLDVTEIGALEEWTVSRVIIKSAVWTLREGGGEGAPEAVFVVACMACRADSGPVENDRLAVEMWALKHTGMNPSHRLFQLRTESYWWTAPAPGNPYHERESESGGP